MISKPSSYGSEPYHFGRYLHLTNYNRSFVFHHRRPMACLSLNLYDTPGLAPRMNVLF